VAIYLNIAALIVVGAFTWWLTGFDKTASGESKRGHHLTRALRVVAMVFLFWTILSAGNLGPGAVPVLIIAPLGMALVMRSCISEIFAHGFLSFIDPSLHDKREFDPKKTQRYQDAIARLIHTGKREEAIKLCEELKKSGEVPVTTLEDTLEFLGVNQNRSKIKSPLQEASRLRASGNFSGAESLLKSLLAKNPADDGAALMLMRVYAQDLKQPEQARAVLQALEKQPHVSAAHLEFARRSLDEWSNPQADDSGSDEMPELAPVDDLLMQGNLGTAVRILETQAREYPENFELQLKLAETYAVHCNNLMKAEKLIRTLELRSRFSPDQISRAWQKVDEWRLASERQQESFENRPPYI